MIVYHGTGQYNLDSLLASSPRRKPRQYLGGRRAFSTSTAFQISSLFALRQSPPALLQGDESGAGVVLEYAIDKSAREGRDWCHAKCSGVLQDEKEIAILNVVILRARAVWRLENGDWERHVLDHQIAEK